MRRFEFRLESVLAWRKLQAEMEKTRLERLFGELHQIDARLRQLDEQKHASARAVLGRPAVEGAELTALGGYLKEAERRGRALAGERALCETRIDEQRRRVVEAERNTRLLEKLKQRRLEEWRAESDRELETLATETFLAHWGKDP